MNLSLYLLGPFHVTLNDQTAHFATDRARALLAYLAVEADRPHRREALADLLWPDRPEAAARQNLSQDLVRLRRAIHDHDADPPFLHITAQTVQFDAATADVDVRRFQSLLGACAAHVHHDLASCPDCMNRFHQASELYRGNFLQGFALKENQPFNEWLLFQQEQLHRQALDGLETVIRHAAAAFDYAQVRGYAERQIALEPWYEPGHRHLMYALAVSGQPNAALAQYETCSRILATELGVEPSPETVGLYEHIRAGEGSLASRTLAPALPTPLTPFVGRERELAEITARIADPAVRLLTLVGAGGMGKTRLALESARQIDDPRGVIDGLQQAPEAPLGTSYSHSRDFAAHSAQPSSLVTRHFTDGLCFVSLAPLATPDAIAPAIASALDLPLQGGDPQHLVTQALAAKRLLLILDNFEHLLPGAGFIIDLLQAAPGVQLLVTSRTRLNVPGEHVYTVEGMETPPSTDLDEAAASSAVRLFVQSARRGLSNFRLDETNIGDVLKICRLVGGMPLGLELAAAWVEMLTLDEIAAEIEQSADFLAYQLPSVPERQHSLRAVFDWSWRLLSDAERQTLRQLSVFRGGFTRDAAQTILGATLPVLTRLVYKSLLRWGRGQDSAGRYEMHELLRQFAAERLDALADESAVVEERHCMFYLAFVAQRERRLARNEPREAAAEIRGEIDNVRQGWACAALHTHLHELESAAYPLWLYHQLVGSISEGGSHFALAAEHIQTDLKRRLERGLEIQTGQRLLSKIQAICGSAAIAQGKHDQALTLAEQAIGLGQVCGGVEGEVFGLLVKGQALTRKEQILAAQSLLEHTARLASDYRRHDVRSEILPDVERLAYNWLCSIALQMDDYRAAKRYVEQGLRLCQDLGKLKGEFFCLTDLKDIAVAVGDYAAARQHCEEALHLARKLAYPRGQAAMQYNLGEIAQWQGQYSLAHDLTEHALAIYRKIGDPFGQAYTSRHLGYLNIVMGNYSLAQQWIDYHFQFVQAADLQASELIIGLLQLALLAHYTSQHEQALVYAEQAWQIAEQHDSLLHQAQALSMLGHLRAQLGLSEAAATYQRAIDRYEALGATHLAVEPRAGLAELAWAQNDQALALALVEAVLETLTARTRVSQTEPFSIYLTCYHVLDAAHDSRAWTVLQQGQDLLQEYANHITDETVRQSFLENVPVHRELRHAYTQAQVHPLPPMEAVPYEDAVKPMRHCNA